MISNSPSFHCILLETQFLEYVQVTKPDIETRREKLACTDLAWGARGKNWSQDKVVPWPSSEQ